MNILETNCHKLFLRENAENDDIKLVKMPKQCFKTQKRHRRGDVFCQLFVQLILP